MSERGTLGCCVENEANSMCVWVVLRIVHTGDADGLRQMVVVMRRVDSDCMLKVELTGSKADRIGGENKIRSKD